MTRKPKEKKLPKKITVFMNEKQYAHIKKFRGMAKGIRTLIDEDMQKSPDENKICNKIDKIQADVTDIRNRLHCTGETPGGKTP